MDPDDDTAKLLDKTTYNISQIFLMPIKVIFWPFRFLWGKFKNSKINKAQENKKKATKKPINEEYNEEILKNKK